MAQKKYCFYLLIALLTFSGFFSHLSFAELDLQEFMPLSEIKPGMTGMGKTVFSGTKIEEFQVEVLGIRRNTTPRRSIIWGRMAGGPLEKTGVIAGMSGSPIYIEGRLIGALAYGFSFSKEPLVGITPIEEMLAVLEKTGPEEMDVPRKSWRSMLEKSPESVPSPESIPALTGDLSGRLPGFNGDEEPLLVPLATPLMFSGFAPSVSDRIAPLLKRMGFLPVQAGGTTSRDSVQSPPLEPGAGLGVQFVKGDLNLFGVGTLTYRRGDRVIAFGHPMSLLGKVAFPISTVDILFVVPNLVISFKYGSPIESIGTLTQDRPAAVSGTIGATPEMIPMTVQVRKQEGEEEQFRYEIMRDRFYTPMLTWATVLSTIESAGKLLGDHAVALKTTLTLKDRPPFSVQNFFSGFTAPLSAARSVEQVVAALVMNSFEQAEIQNITSTVSLVEKQQSAHIEGIQVDKRAVRPGKTVKVTVLLRPYLQPVQVRRITLEIPEETPEGPAQVRVYAGQLAAKLDHTRAPFKYRPKNLDDLIGILTEMPGNHEIVADLLLRKTGVSVGGAELPSLPVSMISILASSKQAGAQRFTRGSVLYKRRIPTEFIISGQHTLTLTIDRQAI